MDDMHVFEIAELREKGLDDEALFPEDQLLTAEEDTWAFIELFCNQFFEPRIYSDTDSNAIYPAMKLDGKGKSYARLPIPIISLSSLVIDSTSVTTSDVIVYNRYPYPDDRRRPKLELDTGAAVSSFRTGKQNIVIEGTFGYVDKDGRPPRALMKVAMKILLLEFPPLVGSPGYRLPYRGKLISEMSDDYMYKLDKGQSINGATGVPEIDRVLFMYRRDDFVRGVVI